ncbi:MAG TPA: small multi-drug export protein [Candidatus Cloacimonadota bacterium]|nr:small multi-drug export protein [Candidatus Cloacimonadota bacterium]
MMKRCWWTLILVMALSLLDASVGTRAATWLQGYGLAPWIVIVIIANLPVVELRGAIPVAILLFKMPWYEAMLISVFANMIPIPFILLFMDELFALLSRNKHGKRFTEGLFARTRNKGKQIEKYEAWGLAIFVGIPLPGTGGWTGAVAANIFGIRFWRSILFIFIGVVMAGALVTSLTMMGKFALT